MFVKQRALFAYSSGSLNQSRNHSDFYALFGKDRSRNSYAVDYLFIYVFILRLLKKIPTPKPFQVEVSHT